MKNDKFIITGLAAILAFMAFKKETSQKRPEPELGILPGYYGPFSDSKNDKNLIYKKWANIRGLDWKLLKAFAIVESDENPTAVNPKDPSYGLMQVLCSGNGEICTNKLNVPDWNSATKTKLLDPDFNMNIASSIIKWNVDNYPLNKAIAIYNNWGARNTPEGEAFPNQSYVDKVLGVYRGL